MNVLLVEPNYKNKYPPMGLMKISTYHKNRGDSVLFFKGVMEESEFKKFQFDRVYITSLFTFYYSITVKTIKEYQKLISASNIYVGGIMATLMKEKLQQDIDKKAIILTGLLEDTKTIGFDDHYNIDILPLDYSILDDIKHKYPAGDNYFAYISRGCTNKCKFCAVPTLEPQFCLTNNIVKQIKKTSEKYGEKQNLLLLDNNILSLSEEELKKVVEDIYSLGFDKKTKFLQPFPLTTYLNKLSNPNISKSAFDNLLEELILYIESKSNTVMTKTYKEKYLQINDEISKSDNKYNAILKNKEVLYEILKHYYKPVGRRRCVDFNQGIDARQLTDEKMKTLSKIPLEPFRLAFDNIKYSEIYTRALKIAHKHGVKSFSNYLLYNYDDRPEELWQRLKINIDLAKELEIKIFSFPMKYAPIDITDRKYIGKHWNKQYLSNIYAILNVTKGIVADGESFFNKAFGSSPEEMFEILTMPREFVTYRSHFEKIGLTFEWQRKYRELNEVEKSELIKVLSEGIESLNSKIIDLLPYYEIKKK